jgi:hypothetical protein
VGWWGFVPVGGRGCGDERAGGRAGGRGGGEGEASLLVFACSQKPSSLLSQRKRRFIFRLFFPLPPPSPSPSPSAAARNKLPLPHFLSLPHRFAHFVARMIRCGKCADCAEGGGSGGGEFVPVGGCGGGEGEGCGGWVKARQAYLFFAARSRHRRCRKESIASSSVSFFLCLLPPLPLPLPIRCCEGQTPQTPAPFRCRIGLPILLRG